MIVDTQSGNVAVKWAIQQRNPPPVQIDKSGNRYIFSPKQNIFLAWVIPDDVPLLLQQKAKICNCNNGTYKIAFELASTLDVLLWETGSRDGQLEERFQEK